LEPPGVQQHLPASPSQGVLDNPARLSEFGMSTDRQTVMETKPIEEERPVEGNGRMLQ